MFVSVVINTYNRRAGIEQTLDGLRRQTRRDFEVVVVHGPSTDGTGTMLARLAPDVRVVDLPERHLGRSRNAGIDAAAGDVVAFIDDDAVPEPRWLEDLLAPYADTRVGGVGGLVLDHTGVRPQYRYSVCGRTGEPDFDREPPLDPYVRPGADPFLYLQGTNCSFRREALAQVGGFDEEIEYNFDETEVCLQLIDAGWRLVALADAVVHHRFLPSDRRDERTFTDPFLEVKNRVYFALRHGPGPGAALASANRYLGLLRVAAREAARRGELSAEQLSHYLGRADAGFHVGLRRGMGCGRSGRKLAARNPAGFCRYPVLAPEPRRRVVLAGRPAEAAEELSAAGHEVHVLLVAGPDAPHRIDYGDGAWLHTVPVRARWLPELDGNPLREPLERAVALRSALEPLRAREPVDLEADVPEPLGGVLEADEEQLQALLRREAALSPVDAARAARRLLQPDRFPTDYELGVRACLGLPEDDDFVECLYESVLGRPAESYGRETSLAHLLAGADRLALVERVARSPEARGRGVDPVFVARLPRVSLRSAEAALREAWLRDDETFALRAHALLFGTEPDVATDVARLAGGMERAALVAGLAAHASARERVAGAERLPPADVLTETQLGVALDALMRLLPPAFVDGAYRLLLGRQPDVEGAAGYVGSLAGGGRSRGWILTSLAASGEAAARGVPADVVQSLVARSRRYRLDAAQARVRARVRRLSARARGAAR